jgi:hypothetical protein
MYRLNFPGRALISSAVGQIEDDVRLTVALVFLALWIPGCFLDCRKRRIS